MEQATDLCRGRRPSGPLVVFSVLTTIGLYIVILIGFLDTETGSALGCGRFWPLCNGKLVPSATLQSIIEYAHRAITGIVGLMVLAMVVWAWRRCGRHPEVRALGAIGLGFVVVQAVIGAAAVIWPESPEVLALHFGFALLSFAGVALLTVVLLQLRGLRRGGAGRPTGLQWRLTRPPRRIVWFIWGNLVYMYGVVYWGTYVAHRGAGLACRGWPLCNGKWFPGFGGLVGIVFIHRLLALSAIGLMLVLLLMLRKLKHERPDLYRGSHVAWGLVLLQAASGAYLILSQLTVTADLIHVSIMTVLFTALSYLGMQVLPIARDRIAPVNVGEPDSGGAVRHGRG